MNLQAMGLDLLQSPILHKPTVEVDGLKVSTGLDDNLVDIVVDKLTSKDGLPRLRSVDLLDLAIISCALECRAERKDLAFGIPLPPCVVIRGKAPANISGLPGIRRDARVVGARKARGVVALGEVGGIAEPRIGPSGRCGVIALPTSHVVRTRGIGVESGSIKLDGVIDDKRDQVVDTTKHIGTHHIGHLPA